MYKLEENITVRALEVEKSLIVITISVYLLVPLVLNYTF